MFSFWRTPKQMQKKTAAQPAVAAHIDVQHEQDVFRVAVRRNPRSKRLTLKMSRISGEPVLTLPPRVSLSVGQTFAQKHAHWIATRIKQRAITVYFEDGAVFPLRGTMTQIIHQQRVIGGIAYDPDTHTLCVGGQPAHLSRRVCDYLKKQALHDLTQAVRFYENKIGLKSTGITLRDTVSRWGSCSSRGHLNFSWRLIMAPDFVLDYLAAHEVAHLQEMNHSVRYWHLLKGICAHTDEAERWIKQHGAALHLYQVKKTKIL